MEVSMVNGEPLRVLLVEDNPAHAKLVFKGLENHKICNVITHVSDGEQAVNYLFRLEQFADQKDEPYPHVILLDLRLPKVDGLEVLKKIKQDEQLSRIPVVVLTTSDAEQDIARAYDHHANAYLTKPVDFTKFLHQMNDLGFFWLCWNVNPWCSQ